MSLVGRRALVGRHVADSTRTSSPFCPRALTGLLCAAALAVVGGLSAVPAARADGDPASDVLSTQPLFLPADGGLTGPQQAQLAVLLQAASRGGLRLRVALIAGPADLGSISELWRDPRDYARFLGQELSLVFNGKLMVVMPSGLGFYGPGAAALAARAGLRATRPGAPGPAFGAAAISDIRRLAAASGQGLSITVLSAHRAAARTDYVALIALVVGGLLIAICWAASLRARPLRPEPG